MIAEQAAMTVLSVLNSYLCVHLSGSLVGLVLVVVAHISQSAQSVNVLASVVCRSTHLSFYVPSYLPKLNELHIGLRRHRLSHS